MKILVTGASGNVGQFTVEHLLKQNESVVAASTHPEKLKSVFSDRVERVSFDFTDPETFSPALKDVDRVFLIRPPHLGDPSDLYPFIDALKDKGIKLISFLSLMGIEKNPIPPHHKIEKYIEENNIPYAHIRPSFFMRNISGIHSKEIREGDTVFVPAGNSKTSFIDAKDIGAATALILSHAEKHQNTTHTLTGIEALDYYEIAEILTKVTGRKVTYSKPGFLRYRHHYIKHRKLDKAYVNVTVALYFMTRMGTAEAVTDDFFNLTGRKPTTFRALLRGIKKVLCEKSKSDYKKSCVRKWVVISRTQLLIFYLLFILYSLNSLRKLLRVLI